MEKTIVTPTRSQIATAALILLLVGGAAIAFSPIFVRLSELGPVATAFWRMALALPAFWLWAAWPVSGSSPAPPAWGHYRWLGLAGIFFAGDLIAWHWALEFTTVSNSTILANCAPILVT
ncbi:MAG TPA: EamA/RhaT family transporter, partial [Anaerolineae bacterium]|nr:EamA/RhaT family transporter [Anaerolineae bacterium]